MFKGRIMCFIKVGDFQKQDFLERKMPNLCSVCSLADTCTLEKRCDKYLCRVCNMPKFHNILSQLCRSCEDEGFCTSGCGAKGVSRIKRCDTCEREHNNGMKKIKQWLVNNNYVHTH
jgi:hypothetical protein